MTLSVSTLQSNRLLPNIKPALHFKEIMLPSRQLSPEPGNYLLSLRAAADRKEFQIVKAAGVFWYNHQLAIYKKKKIDLLAENMKFNYCYI